MKVAERVLISYYVLITFTVLMTKYLTIKQLKKGKVSQRRVQSTTQGDGVVLEANLAPAAGVRNLVTLYMESGSTER